MKEEPEPWQQPAAERDGYSGETDQSIRGVKMVWHYHQN